MNFTYFLLLTSFPLAFNTLLAQFYLTFLEPFFEVDLINLIICFINKSLFTFAKLIKYCNCLHFNCEVRQFYYFTKRFRLFLIKAFLQFFKINRLPRNSKYSKMFLSSSESSFLHFIKIQISQKNKENCSLFQKF